MIRGVIYIRGGAKAMIRATPKVMKQALREALLYWHEKFAPRHFDRTAYSRYHYQRRSARYEQRKMRKFGHQRPLVWTGRMMREVLSAIKITGTSKQAKGALRGPRYLYQYRKDYRQPDKAAELLKTTKKEERELAKVIDQVITDAMSNLRETETIRI